MSETQEIYLGRWYMVKLWFRHYTRRCNWLCPICYHQACKIWERKP